MTQPLIYLASPYSDPDPAVMARRAACVAAVTARLLKEGKHVFSPIAYCHQFAVEHGMGTDWDAWKEFGTAMLEKCDEISILNIPGWKGSVGIRGELSSALDGDMPRGDIIQPTPEELAILDEPKEDRPPCKWHKPNRQISESCSNPAYSYMGTKSGECMRENGLYEDGATYCRRYERRAPITQPEPKCKFWSDEGGESCKHCRMSEGEYAEHKESICHVVHQSWKNINTPTECEYFQPAEEPKTATLSLGTDGMKLEPEMDSTCRWWRKFRVSGEPNCDCPKVIREWLEQSQKYGFSGAWQCCPPDCESFAESEKPDEEAMQQAMDDYRDEKWQSAQEVIEELAKPDEKKPICKWFDPSEKGDDKCRHPNLDSDWSICSRGEKGQLQLFCHEACAEPTAEEKIVEGLEGFADELEEGRQVAHPCKWWDDSEEKCVSSDQNPRYDDGFGIGECPLGDDRMEDGWTPSICDYYGPREIQHPEDNPDDAKLITRDQLAELCKRSYDNGLAHGELLAEINGLTERKCSCDNPARG